MIDSTYVCIALVLVLTLLAVAGDYVGSRRMKIEAVSRGFGEWATDGEGVTTFRWKEVKDD